MPLKIYPREYNHFSIGILWNTMAQFQTWFGSQPYFASGIQLLPLTPIAEARDGVNWATKLYPAYASYCNSDPECVRGGWSVQQLALLATIGHAKLAARGAVSLPPKVFDSAGGNGHSLSNTLWYAATRPLVANPPDLANIANVTLIKEINAVHEDHERLVDCGIPHRCTDDVLDTIADEYSCRQRMTFLMETEGRSQLEACKAVAGTEFPRVCGACNPDVTISGSASSVVTCRPCTPEECQSDLNRCPSFESTFVCTSGQSRGGCSSHPWPLSSGQCSECCELSKCPSAYRDESKCPQCSREICRGSAKDCPPAEIEPFLCTGGKSSPTCSLFVSFVFHSRLISVHLNLFLVRRSELRWMFGSSMELGRWAMLRMLSDRSWMYSFWLSVWSHLVSASTFPMAIRFSSF
jgi:Glycosyl hydrolase family 81 C-terminal domain